MCFNICLNTVSPILLSENTFCENFQKLLSFTPTLSQKSFLKYLCFDLLMIPVIYSQNHGGSRASDKVRKNELQLTLLALFLHQILCLTPC